MERYIYQMLCGGPVRHGQPEVTLTVQRQAPAAGIYPDIRVRYAYDPPAAGDGIRVLVDHAWPRGLSRGAAHIHEWIPALAPPARLRRWHGREPGRFPGFRRCYRSGLREPQRALALTRLQRASARGTVTLLTAWEDLEHSPAAVLAERLRDRDRGRPAVARSPGRAGQAQQADRRCCRACGQDGCGSPPPTR